MQFLLHSHLEGMTFLFCSNARINGHIHMSRAQCKILLVHPQRCLRKGRLQFHANCWLVSPSLVSASAVARFATKTAFVDALFLFAFEAGKGGICELPPSSHQHPNVCEHCWPCPVSAFEASGN